MTVLAPLDHLPRPVHEARARAWASLSEHEREKRLRKHPSFAGAPELFIPCPVHAGCGAIVKVECFW